MNVRQKAVWVFVMLACSFTLISLRLVQLQLIDHEYYRERAIKNHCRQIPLPARRGSILDRNGSVLAQTYLTQDLRLDAEEFFKKPEGMIVLARELGMTPAALSKMIDPANRYQLIAKALPEETVTRLKASAVRGLVFDPKLIRSYPNGAHASHLVGFLSDSEKGASGVEAAFDSYLRGIPGERWIERNARGKEIAAYRSRDTEPKDGMTVTTTIDLGIQHIVEEELDKLQGKYNPNSAMIIVMNPKTGEVLAMGNRPTFDPNRRVDLTEIANLRNRCLTDMHEPGSTFKIVTMAAALNERLVGLETPIFCENGQFFYADHWLHDTEPSGMLSVLEVLMRSSNIGMAKLAMAMGEDRLYNYAVQFGFGQLTDLLPRQGEARGILRPVNKWSKLSVTRIPMGQEVGATPMQMIEALSTVANGGRMMRPRLIKEINDEDGQIVKQFRPEAMRQVIRPETAQMVTKALKAVCTPGGTGVKAIVPGFETAGKTGTAQKAAAGGYAKDKYVASFMGFFPANDPEVVMLVMVDEPKGREYYGGSVAAPAFSEMGTQIAQCLNLSPKTGGITTAKRSPL